MSDVVKTLSDRQTVYGSMEDNAECTQARMDALQHAPSYQVWSDMHKECIHMILHKISRLAVGDPNHLDSVHDIGGYAKLLEDYVNAQNNR